MSSIWEMVKRKLTGRSCSFRKRCSCRCAAIAIGDPALLLQGSILPWGVKIFFTHGHLYGVKSGEYNIVCAARERKAQVLLYGHTHNAFTDYEDGLYLMNPGSLSGWQATYGTLDLTEQGIVTNVVTLP